MENGIFASLAPALRLALHLLPLWPLYERRWPLFAALLLLMFLPYVKMKKMAADDLPIGDWANDKRAAFYRWRALTFFS